MSLNFLGMSILWAKQIKFALKCFLGSLAVVGSSKSFKQEEATAKLAVVGKNTLMTATTEV